MNNPFIDNRRSRALYGSIWTGLALIQILLCYFKTNLTIAYLLGDSLIFNGLYMICVLIVWYPTEYYKNVLNIPLFLIFHLLLFALCMLICSGATLLLGLLPGSPYPDFFYSTFPFRLIVSLLLYVIAVISYHFIQSRQEWKKQALCAVDPVNESGLPPEKLTRIMVKKDRKIHFISVNDIFYVESNGDYVLIYTAAGRFLKDQTMKYMETHLPDDRFVRIHRSYIINMEYIEKMELYEKDLYQVQLKEGTSLKVSAAGYKLLKQKMR
jgi:uncharacterized membrane protein